MLLYGVFGMLTVIFKHIIYIIQKYKSIKVKADHKNNYVLKSFGR